MAIAVIAASWRAAAAAALLGASFVSLAQAPASAPAEAVVARDMREETQRIVVTVKDMYGRQETKPVPITIFRPRGEGPFPLAIMNHGRATTDKRAQQGRQRYEDLSRYLVAKGFVVMLPTRVGYAETYGDFDPEETGNCNAKRLEPMAEAVYAQVIATLDFAKTLPYVDASRWLVVGQSVGGMTAVVTVGRHPHGLIAGSTSPAARAATLSTARKGRAARTRWRVCGTVWPRERLRR